MWNTDKIKMASYTTDDSIFWLFFHSRLYWQGIIFRFKFLMLVTLACAAMTIIFFILNQVSVISIEGFSDHIMFLSTVFELLAFKCSDSDPGQWRPLALGRLHSPGQQCFSHRDLWHVESVRVHHHLPLRTLPQAEQTQVGRLSTNRSVIYSTIYNIHIYTDKKLDLLYIFCNGKSYFSKIMFTLGRCDRGARESGDAADMWRAGANRDVQDDWEGGWGLATSLCSRSRLSLYDVYIPIIWMTNNKYQF